MTIPNILGVDRHILYRAVTAPVSSTRKSPNMPGTQHRVPNHAFDGYDPVRSPSTHERIY